MMKNKTMLKGSKATASTQNKGSELKKPFKVWEIEQRKIMNSALAECIKPNPNNRGGNIDWDKVHYIAKSVAEYNTGYKLMPIIVDRDTHVISEGHHTYYAEIEVYEKYGYEFPVSVEFKEYPKDKNIDEITAGINNDRDGWKLVNYINLYILQGNKNYINLKKMADEIGGVFIKNGEIRWRYISALCGRSCQQELRDGTYQLSDKQMAEQIELGKMINNLIEKASKSQESASRIAAWLESFTLAFVHGISQYNARGMKNYYNSVYNRIDSITFDGSQSTCLWAERLSGMDKAA